MQTSATGLRERRIAENSRRLIAVARSWTVERGFAGFTVEELCEEVGVSRRTFFNYFAGKDDVVLGVPTRIDHTALEEAFVAGGGAPHPNGLSEGLLTELAELMIARWEVLGLLGEEVDALIAAIEAAPKLLGRALAMTRDQELVDIALVERREGLEPGDLRASTVVHLLGSLLRAAVEESFRGDGSARLRPAFARRLAAARTVFSS